MEACFALGTEGLSDISEELEDTPATILARALGAGADQVCELWCALFASDTLPSLTYVYSKIVCVQTLWQPPGMCCGNRNSQLEMEFLVAWTEYH